jgi:oligosaccharide repeat unit polymerase
MGVGRPPMSSEISIPNKTLGGSLLAPAAILSILGVLVSFLVLLGAIPATSLATLLLGTASACFLLIRSRRTFDLLHPVRVFGSLWCFCLALASMRLSPLISAWDSLMWSCVLTALVAFVGGFWFVRWNSGYAGVGQRLARMEAALGKSQLANKRTLLVAAFCLAAGMTALTYEYSLVGGIPVLSDNPDAARTELFGVGGVVSNPKFDTLSVKIIHPFVDFIKYAVFLALIILFQRKTRSRSVVYLATFMVLFGMLAYGSQGGRGFIIDIAVTGVALFHYLRRRIRLVEFGGAVLALFLFLGLYGAYRIDQSESAPLFGRALQESSFPEGVLGEGLALGYTTVTSSFEVFYRLTSDLRNTTSPSSGFLFYSLHRFIPRTNLGTVTGDLYSGELLTSTFLGELYADYRYWGVLIGSLVLGLVYGWAYSRAGGRNPLYGIYVRAMLLRMLVFLPYANLFSGYLNWIFDLFFMYVIIRYIQARPLKEMTPAAVAA